VLAAMTRYRWVPVQVHCYGTTLDRQMLAIRCLWHGALGGQLVQVVLSRPVGAPDGYQLALVTTDLAATPAMIIERYADRWSVETMFLDARHLAGVGQARTRTKHSVERLVPFGLACLSLAICWYAHHGQPAHDLAAHRARAPWYRHKQAVSVADMLAALRRALLAAQYRHGHLDQHGFRNFTNYRLRLLLHGGVRWQTHRTARLRGRSPRLVAQDAPRGPRSTAWAVPPPPGRPWHAHGLPST